MKCGIVSTIGFMAVTVAIGLLALPPAAAFNVHHDLHVVLKPDQNRLEGTDIITIGPAPTHDVILALNEKATELELTVDDKPTPFLFQDGRVMVKTNGPQRREPLRVTLSYAAVFNDPAPVMPANTDNPGYGVSGTVSPRGTFLLFGSGWYPHFDAEQVTFRLTVEAPVGIKAVTAGRSLGHYTEQGKTYSTWVIDHPVRGLALSAARFDVREKRSGRVTAATYFTTASADLSDNYLAATVRYIQLYERLFGPYPFDKFAVVENFFPTGFGFESYTLLGSQILRLPFIIDTSLGHEIAHCWWGNGVFVDYPGGNWSEGLTTYTADYLYKEQASPQEARTYRRQILRNYAALVSPQTDFPINRFQGRFDRVTKTIGYDKTAMVFHMLRQLTGERVFWGALKDVYRDYLFKQASWDDLRRAFERRAGKSLEDFFDQWVYRDGAPRLALQNVRVQSVDTGWRVKGEVVQQLPFFAIEADLALRTENAEHSERFRITDRRTPFDLKVPDRPVALELDAEAHVFRRLEPEEIPPSVNTVKGAEAVLVVMPENASAELRQAADILATGLGLDNFQAVSAARLDRRDVEKSDLLVVGFPPDPTMLAGLDGKVRIERGRFVLNGTVYADPADTFFGVFRHPLTPGRSMAVFYPLSDRIADAVARKVTHYGRYSYLAFSRGQNRAKGTWPVTQSPLIHNWRTGDVRRGEETYDR
jgi:aminopeptidase N